MATKNTSDPGPKGGLASEKVGEESHPQGGQMGSFPQVNVG